MKKIKKLLFSKTFLIVLLVVVQICFFVIGNYLLAARYVYFDLFISALAVIIFLLIVNSDSPSSLILPWIVVITLSPILGVGVYILLGRKTVRKKIINSYKQVIVEKTDGEIEDDKLSGESKFIKKSSLFSAYKNSESTYLPTGEAFYEQLLIEIKKAEKSIFMEYFIIEKGEMWDSILKELKDKAEKGVKVIVMYDSMGCGTKLPSSYNKQLEKLGIECVVFNKFVPIVTPIHNNRDHRKITVIDGKVAFIGGSNLADEYINKKHPYGVWRDSNLMIKGEAVNNFLLMFVEQYNAANNQKKIINYEDYIQENNLIISDEVLQPFACGPTPIYYPRIGESVYLNIINKAEKYVYITTPYLIIDTYFVDALINAHRRGVDVKIMLPSIPDGLITDVMAKSYYKKLIENGVDIEEYKPGFIHSKSAVSDDTRALIGTINLDYRSFIHHFECGVYIENSPTIKKMKDDFDYLTTNCCKSIDLKHFKFNFFKRMLRNVMKVFSPLF